MNRRSAIKMLAGSAVMLGTTRAQSKASRVQIASLDKLESVWSVVQYPYEGRHAILLRVPEQIKDRTLEVQIGIYLVSYHLVCTHLGCTPALPNTDHQLICPCHNSRFWLKTDALPTLDPIRHSKRFNSRSITAWCLRLGIYNWVFHKSSSDENVICLNMSFKLAH